MANRMSPISIVGTKHFFHFFFLNEPVPGTPKIHLQNRFAQMSKELTASGQYQVEYSAKNLSYTETTVRNYKATINMQIARVSRTKAQMFTPFF